MRTSDCRQGALFVAAPKIPKGPQPVRNRTFPWTIPRYKLPPHFAYLKGTGVQWFPTGPLAYIVVVRPERRSSPPTPLSRCPQKA